ncbi:hypothetical protein AGLY_016708 [Aphis glycines]|uniref:PiggyBac transposable element-derived protein domain-containing protein n=1 Tax=Aphis glycines TaxID=307491 RepID=A0A6G0SZ16_APHGL|nr:hypothetical protein AGLY_016708 [Aphis glycines]
MLRHTRRLSKKEIEKCLTFDDIPSGSDLESSDEDHDDYDKDPDFNLYSDNDDYYLDENEINFAPSTSSNLNSTSLIKRRKLNTNFDELDQFSNVTSTISTYSQINVLNKSVLIRPINSIGVPTWSTEYNFILPDIMFDDSQSGVCNEIKEMVDITPLKIFLKLILKDLFELIVFQTNLYATQKNKPYKPTSVEIFFGLNMVMAMKKLPSYRDYWSTSSDLHDHYISPLMQMNRFGWLLGHIHFNDNSVQPKKDCLTTFAECYTPHQNVAVDESMVKFKGRSTIKQYIRDKPIKRGFKIWMLCDSSSYNLKFQVYTGKSDVIGVEKGLGARVVMDIVENLPGKNHIVFMDNFFTSHDLFKILKDNLIYAVGTVNASRKTLPKLKNDKLILRGEYDWKISNTGIVMYKWKDNKCVHLLSSLHSPKDTGNVNRKSKDGNQKLVSCPKVLINCNKNMNFVDNFDRLNSDYKLDRKKIENMPTFINKDFHRSIYNDLLANKIISTENKSSPVTPKARTSVISSKKPIVMESSVRYESSAHQPIRTTSRRCANCSTKKKPIRSIWTCSVCKVNLCMRKDSNCFQNYHKTK